MAFCITYVSCAVHVLISCLWYSDGICNAVSLLRPEGSFWLPLWKGDPAHILPPLMVWYHAKLISLLTWWVPVLVFTYFLHSWFAIIDIMTYSMSTTRTRNRICTRILVLVLTYSLHSWFAVTPNWYHVIFFPFPYSGKNSLTVLHCHYHCHNRHHCHLH